MNAEIALAETSIDNSFRELPRTIGRFEFHGVSLPSGDVGGDLVDVVESQTGWTSFVADVSGHGVAAGLLMGMLKSAVRTQLRTGEHLDGLLNTANTVLFDLKSRPCSPRSRACIRRRSDAPVHGRRPSPDPAVSRGDVSDL